MMIFSDAPSEITGRHRDRVPRSETDSDPPVVVSISDIHGYLAEAQSALLTLADHATLPPVVTTDEDGTLYWAEENYILVFNGDLIDRGPANDAVLKMVSRLTREASPGRVRITLGNHEHILTSPDEFPFRGWYSTQVTDQHRQRFLQWIQAGHIVAAYRGHNVTYAHAGSPDPYTASEVNESLFAAAAELSEALDTAQDAATQRRVTETYETVLGTGDRYLKGTGAGLAWLDFSNLPSDAPPQVVGHTRHATPTQKGAVYCQNVLRKNQGSPGGEAVFVETPDALLSLSRATDGSVQESTLTIFS